MRILGAALAAVLAAAQLAGAIAPTVALAAETTRFHNDHTLDVGPFHAEFFGAYQKVDDAGLSGIAYCMDGAKHGPKEEMVFTRQGDPDVALSYIIAHGYPNTTTIAGTQLSPGAARAATQVAVWHHRDFDITPATSEGEAVNRVGLALCAEAEAYAASGGRNLGCGTVWYTSDDIQLILLTSEPTGGIEVEKSSSNTSVTDDNPLYTLEGAVFSVFSDEECAKKAAEIVTDKAGKGSVEGLYAGDYWVKETKPPAGYALDPTVHKVTVPAGGSVPFKAANEPQTNPIEVLIAKRDAETGKALPQGDGSLGGAEFTVEYYAGLYDEASLPSKPTRTWVLRTDPSGRTGIGMAGKEPEVYLASGDLYRTSDGAATVPLGTVRITETKAPTGYLLGDAKPSVRQIKGAGDGPVVRALALMAVDEQPVRGGLSVRKLDAENHDAQALGAATLEGTVFEVVNRSTHDVRVKGKDFRPGETVMEISTNGKGVAQTGPRDLPFGTYEVREKEAPTGYLLGTPQFSEAVQVRDDGKYAECGRAAENQVKRGDMSWSKVAEEGMGRMGRVAFRVTSKATGESHVVVTDENGMLDTSASWNNHEAKTNANDKAVGKDGKVDESKLDASAGVWFFGRADGKGEPDDSLGALPYDAYLVEELRCEANEGMKLVTFDVTVTRDKKNLDLGTVDDKDGPRIQTELTGKEGVHFAKGTDIVELADHVSYQNLTPGKEYTVKGTLMDKATGEPLLDVDGNPATAETTFKAKSASGTVDVRFTFSAKAAFTATIVAFESLEEDGIEVAVHADIDDEDQTVWVPGIGTTAKDSETGTNVSCADAEVTIVDTVAYENLVPGLKYTLEGALMDKETGKPVADASGKEVTATAEFTPEGPAGEAEVTFAFDGSRLGGHETVVFESLVHDGAVIASHEDIEDEGQTIRFPKIGTTAADKADGDHEVEAAKVEIVDTVAYEGLVPGTEYALTGRLMDKETGKEVAGATASVAFTPDAESGRVDVSFSLDASKLAGHDLVAFEVLTKGEMEIAKHEDIEDEGQTVYVKGPDKATTPKTPTTPKPIPKTGDASIPAAIFAGMGIVSLCAIAGAKRLRAREDAEISISRGEPRGGEKR